MDDIGIGQPYASVRYTIPSGWNGTIFGTWAVNSANSFVNPTQAPGIGSPNSPWYTFNGARGGTVSLGAMNIGTACGSTDVAYINTPPQNHGCCQQKTISGANFNLNTTKGYNDSGRFDANTCDARWTYNHEFGHTLGLGHTKFPDETMFLNEVAVYGAFRGDRWGVSCIYNLVNC